MADSTNDVSSAPTVKMEPNNTEDDLEDPKNFQVDDNLLIKFPHVPYPSQKIFCEQVVKAAQEKKNALLESPTGTGKTAMLLCSTLAWIKSRRLIAQQLERPQNFEEANHHYDIKTPTPATVIYATRTHTQTAAIIEQLKATAYKDEPSVVLGSRNKLCISGSAKSYVTDSLSLEQACQKMRQHFHLEQSPQKRQRQEPELSACSFYHGEESFSGCCEPMDVEEMVSKGKEQGKCPYYATKAMQHGSSLIVCTYNHLLYPYIRINSKIDLRNAVVIFDEAHNIEQICRNAASKKLTLERLDQITFKLDEFEREAGATIPQDLRDAWSNILSKVHRLGQFFHDLEQACQEQEPGFIQTGIRVLDLSQTYVDRFEKYNWSQEDIEKLDANYKTLKDPQNDFQFTNEIDEVASLINVFKYLYKESVQDPETAEWTCPNYKIAFKRQVSRNGTFSNELLLLCNNAAVTFKGVQNYARSVIVASGTLGPLDALAAELGGEFGIQMAFDSVLPKERLLTAFIASNTTDDDADTLTFNYPHVKKGKPDKEENTPVFKKLVANLGGVLLKIVGNVPHGILVFFPSKDLLARCCNLWEENGLLKKLMEIKPLFKEAEQNFEVQVEVYKEAAKSTSGAVLFAWMRGKASEGVDFKNDEARAVVTIGIPYGPRYDEQIIAKREYNTLHNNRLVDGQVWYESNAIRCMNQAFGRCIRHIDDWGAVFVIESRFLYANYSYSSQLKSLVSAWVMRSYDGSVGSSMDEWVPKLQEFVNRMQSV